MTKKQPLTIAIIGAGFSGTALAANLQQFSSQPINILLFEKRGHFGLGEAYSTPYPFHLLNVRAHDMSAFENDTAHFVNWLKQNPAAQSLLTTTQPLEQQFVPRRCYGQYLQEILANIQTEKSQINLSLHPGEVLDVQLINHQAKIFLPDNQTFLADKVVFALGNNPPATFPFAIDDSVQCIHQPWDFTAPEQISSQDPVLIVGTGLSMIDAVLTLHHQKHKGKIYAVSRHGLLPLPHNNQHQSYSLSPEQLPNNIRDITKVIRNLAQTHQEQQGDWRNIVSALRIHFASLWKSATQKDKTRFLRHVLPYWNIHRHRVPDDVADLLSQLANEQQLSIFAGRIKQVKNGEAEIAIRHEQTTQKLPVKWMINCMGPAQMKSVRHSLLQTLLKRGTVCLDELNLGFSATDIGALKNAQGEESHHFFTLGPPSRGIHWESSAVPDIRKQCAVLARHLLAIP